ncbi:hypothetical protein GAGA_1038 [Paraglaciecola agarilytica NO2]|uniref:Uncharacterized protein n=1 Tax=Paraglaciecola agarilytica NO2 TaxID=1125747 RepID=A0ABQ0I3H7_9ALTE|nr:hypothetical protein GAGA_1038 [Paraglaciecola agarilytica NO2]
MANRCLFDVFEVCNAKAVQYGGINAQGLTAYFLHGHCVFTA